MEKLEWTGLEPERFEKYKTWKNKHKPGICGTYVTAVMLHDFLRENYEIEISQEKLLKGLKQVIDDWMPYRGTFFWDLQHGLNYMLKGVDGWRPAQHLVPEIKVKEILSGPYPRPVAVGTSKLLGSRYKNHWVLVYAYAYDSKGRLHFKCYDNHGRHDAVITATEAIACVWIEETH